MMRVLSKCVISDVIYDGSVRFALWTSYSHDAQRLKFVANAFSLPTALAETVGSSYVINTNKNGWARCSSTGLASWQIANPVFVSESRP